MGSRFVAAVLAVGTFSMLQGNSYGWWCLAPLCFDPLVVPISWFLWGCDSVSEVAVCSLQGGSSRPWAYLDLPKGGPIATLTAASGHHLVTVWSLRDLKASMWLNSWLSHIKPDAAALHFRHLQYVTQNPLLWFWAKRYLEGCQPSLTMHFLFLHRCLWNSYKNKILLSDLSHKQEILSCVCVWFMHRVQDKVSPRAHFAFQCVFSVCFC